MHAAEPHPSSPTLAGTGQAKDYKQEKGDWLSSVWAGFNSPSQTSRIRNTGVPVDFLKEVPGLSHSGPGGMCSICHWIALR